MEANVSASIEPIEQRRGEYRLTTDPARVDVAVVHAYLARSYWAAHIPLEIVRASIENSLPFSVWHEPAGGTAAQVAFARAISDYATFAYVGDVFVLEAHRGRGISKWIMEFMIAHPRLQGLRRWILATRDAHGLYAQSGFTPLEGVERWMERRMQKSYGK
jgi:GNAT superfamily N-acetyltransferase